MFGQGMFVPPRMWHGSENYLRLVGLNQMSAVSVLRNRAKPKGEKQACQDWPAQDATSQGHTDVNSQDF